MSGLINAHDFTPTVVSVSGSLLMDTYYVCTAAGTTTQTLPATSGSGKVIIIENLGAGTITLSGTGSDTINGVTSLTLAPYGVIKIRDYAVGTWYIQTGNVSAYFPNASTTPGLLNYYAEGSFTAYCIDGTNISSGQTVYYTRVNNAVTVYFPNLSIQSTLAGRGITTTNSAAVYTWPANITPARDQHVPYQSQYNNAGQASPAMMIIYANGSVYIYKDYVGNTWGTNNYINGMYGGTISYLLI